MSKICKVCLYVSRENDKLNGGCICGFRDWEDYDEYQIKQISSDEKFVKSMLDLKNNDPIEYQLKLNQFKLQQEQKEQFKRAEQKKNVPHCPHCKSANIKSISGLNRGASIAIWGIFSKKINKSFECKDCGYTW